MFNYFYDIPICLECADGDDIDKEIEKYERTIMKEGEDV